MDFFSSFLPACTFFPHRSDKVLTCVGQLTRQKLRKALAGTPPTVGRLMTSPRFPGIPPEWKSAVNTVCLLFCSIRCTMLQLGMVMGLNFDLTKSISGPNLI
jgi:hypothetical protein